uniref:Uncharacterized protein ORF107 n=1 Tax=Phaeoceros laevis TaxID=37308 RepID=D3J0I7_9EMBR|nr:hypothetical protein PhlaMp14 [Phaeoceros laevis]ACT75301.1 hypothetical protein PhlaMp14 [Phaeoceros laevis]
MSSVQFESKLKDAKVTNNIESMLTDRLAATPHYCMTQKQDSPPELDHVEEVHDRRLGRGGGGDLKGGRPKNEMGRLISGLQKTSKVAREGLERTNRSALRCLFQEKK